jgi:hypothetical protein
MYALLFPAHLLWYVRDMDIFKYVLIMIWSLCPDAICTNTSHTVSLELRIFNIMKQLYYRTGSNRKRGELSVIHLLISVVIYRPLTGTPWTLTTGGTTSPSPSRRQSKHCLLFTLHCHKYISKQTKRLGTTKTLIYTIPFSSIFYAIYKVVHTFKTGR